MTDSKTQCDERTPKCTPCRKASLSCTGYRQNLVWVSQDQRSYRHNGRRFLSPCNTPLPHASSEDPLTDVLSGETWKDFPLLSSSHTDDLIQDCDIDAEDDGCFEILRPPFSVFRSSPSVSTLKEYLSCIDFGIRVPSLIEPAQRQRQIDSDWANCHIGHQPSSSSPTAETPHLPLLKAPRAESRLDPQDAYLFYHYLNHIAPSLIPVHGSTNPWLRYPAIALHLSHDGGKKHLLHAMMAQAALCLSNSGEDRTSMSRLGTKLYLSAMADFRNCIERASFDYLGVLTTMLTFLFIEVRRPICSV